MEVKCGKIIKVRQVLWNPYWMEPSGSLGVLRPVTRQLVETWAYSMFTLAHLTEPAWFDLAWHGCRKQREV